MADDLKQKETEAWANYDGRSPLRACAAVSASIAAALAEALAPVLERVARLEELAQFPKLLAENDALLRKMAVAPCAICGGARFVCDCVGHWLKGKRGCPWSETNEVICRGNNRRPCPECSAPKTEEAAPSLYGVAVTDVPPALASAERRIAELVHSIAFIKAEGERRGRAAGIHEAAEQLKYFSCTCHTRVLVLLDKKSEETGSPQLVHVCEFCGHDLGKDPQPTHYCRMGGT